MALTSGTRLGPYEIVSPLGAGGMGEVYRAKDTRLDRDVAIKILPDGFADSDLMRARFEREAKSISSLNHASICTLFDVGHHETLLFLVMELIEGESLADRLAKGALPPDQVVKFGAQIADALDHAHKQGIVHRDLKPGNVMLTKSGAKLLDFGLARTATENQRPADGMTSHPTQVRPLTQEGTILGTFQYMAPEQLEGEEADGRTDIFALGAVLYEMATGRRAFEGKTKTSLIAAIVSSQPPPISTVQALAPRALDHIVRRCLEKDRDDRWQSARDVASELRWIADAGSQSGVAAPITVRRVSREKLAWLLASVMAVTAISVAAVAWRGSGAVAKPVSPATMRFVEPIGEIRSLLDTFHLQAISPDGKDLAWVSVQNGQAEIHLRHLGEPDGRKLPGTEGAQQIFFSPDGKWLGFFAGGKLKKAPIGGGAPVTLAKAVLPRGAAWGDDDSIVFVPFYYGGVERISASGGNREVLTTPDRSAGETAHRWPSLLPGGKAFLYSIGYGSSWDEAKIAVQRIGSKERKIVVEGGTNARYLPTGHLVYARGGSMYAVRFNAETLEVSGNPVQVIEGLANANAGAAEYSVSRDGLLVYRTAGSLSDEGGQLAMVERNGKVVPLGAAPLTDRAITSPSLSPGGDRIAGVVGYEVWAFDLARGTSTRLTSETRATQPIWSPDGRTLAFGEERRSPWNPYLRRADGNEPEQLLLKSETSLLPSAWSRDGKFLLLDRNEPETGNDILVYSFQDRSLKPFVVTEQNEGGGVFSPDGKWVVYHSGESGRDEIYVRAFDGSAGRWQISNEGGSTPVWRKPDEILYQNDRKILSVRVKTSPAFTAEAPRTVLEGSFALVDVMPDSDRLLAFVSEKTERRDAPLRVVLNWFPEVIEKMSK